MTTTVTASILQELIKSRGITVSELARQIGVPQPTIQRIAQGIHAHPRKTTLEAIANFFGITCNHLLGITPLNEPHDETKFLQKIPISNASHFESPFVAKKRERFIYVENQMPRGSFAWIVEDDSMQPMICKNALAIVDPTATPKSKSFVMAKPIFETTTIVRQLIYVNNIGYLRALNHSYEKNNNVLLLKDDAKILGVIREVRSQYD